MTTQGSPKFVPPKVRIAVFGILTVGHDERLGDRPPLVQQRARGRQGEAAPRPGARDLDVSLRAIAGGVAAGGGRHAASIS
jgi:hypothetical protein